MITKKNIYIFLTGFLLVACGCSREQVLKMKGWHKIEYQSKNANWAALPKSQKAEVIRQTESQLKAHPDDPQSLYVLGAICAQDKKSLPLAVNYFKKAVAVNDDVCADVALFLSWSDEKSDKKYIEKLLQRSLKSLKNSDTSIVKVLIYEKIGNTYANLGEYEKSEGYFKMAVELQPDDFVFPGGKEYEIYPGLHSRLVDELKEVEAAKSSFSSKQ